MKIGSKPIGLPSQNEEFTYVLSINNQQKNTKYDMKHLL